MLVNLKFFENFSKITSIESYIGFYEANDINVESLLANAIGSHTNYTYELSYFDVESLSSFGVVDSPQQFYNKFHQILENDPRHFIVIFSHIEKNQSRKGCGGGWRWHKNGAYYGNGTPTQEYLDDEHGFDNGVWIFHIYDVGKAEEMCLCYFDFLYGSTKPKYNITFRYTAPSLEYAKNMMSKIQKRIDSFDKTEYAEVGKIVFIKS